jgi:hypothetical protein
MISDLLPDLSRQPSATKPNKRKANMSYKHITTDDLVWQMHARRAAKGSARSREWLHKRGWSVQQAKRFIAR